MLGNTNLNIFYCRFTATIKLTLVKQSMKIDLVSKPYECQGTCQTCHDGSCGGGGKWLHSYGVNIWDVSSLKMVEDAVCC